MKSAATKRTRPRLATQTGVRWTSEDLKILEALHRKLGVSVIQIVRVALRALARQEKV
jgi:hypothetical protein